MEEDFAFMVPDHYSCTEAVTTPSAVLTILAAFHDFGWPLPYSVDVAYEEPVLVWGGNSSLGQAAISLLKLSGHTNIIVTASINGAQSLYNRGASHVVDYRDKDASSKIQKALGGKPLRRVIDTISITESGQTIMPLIAPDSDLAWVSPEGSPEKEGVRSKFVYCGIFQAVMTPHSRVRLDLRSNLDARLRKRP
jgi:NADPH:quinone reductase-like Zn-dependent oxidoreductase